MVGRWATTLYGFLKADALYDTTQSFGDLAGGGLVERPNGHPPPPPATPINFRGEHPRAQLSLRDSRFGIRVKAPETARVRPSATLELDFFGTLPATATEAQTFTTPVPRMRHGYVKLETPYVDFLAGQTWHVFGWQNTYHPASVQAQGLPGQLYNRSPQLRVSKSMVGAAVGVEAALAVLRPPQRDSGMPELAGGARVLFPGWTGLTTAGATGTSIQPLSVAITGDFRNVALPEFTALPKDTIAKTMPSVAFDAYVPIVPATETQKDDALSMTGELVLGQGVADLYTNGIGGVAMPNVANNTGLNPAPTYPQNIDNGIVVFDLDGNLRAVKWTTLIAGAQYYVHGTDGRLWLAINYAHMESSNARSFTRPYAATLPDPQAAYYVSATQVRDSIDFFDVNVFGEPVDGLRLGFEGAVYVDRYADGVRAVNRRVDFGTIWMF